MNNVFLFDHLKIILDHVSLKNVSSATAMYSFQVNPVFPRDVYNDY